MSDNYLKFNSVSLNKRSFFPKDLRPLFNAQFRGANRVLPGAVGQRPLAPVRDQIDTSIEWVCDGRFNTSDAAQEGIAGLATNLAYYRGIFTSPADAATGQSPGTLYLPQGTLISSLQCWSWDEVWTGPFSARVLTRLVVPSGVWS